MTRRKLRFSNHRGRSEARARPSAPSRWRRGRRPSTEIVSDFAAVLGRKPVPVRAPERRDRFRGRAITAARSAKSEKTRVGPGAHQIGAGRVVAPMAAAGEARDPHARRPCRRDAGHAVLDHEAGAGAAPMRAAACRNRSGNGLPRATCAEEKTRLAEQRQQPGQAQGVAQPHRVAARRDAGRQAQGRRPPPRRRASPSAPRRTAPGSRPSPPRRSPAVP